MQLAMQYSIYLEGALNSLESRELTTPGQFTTTVVLIVIRSQLWFYAVQHQIHFLFLFEDKVIQVIIMQCGRLTHFKCLSMNLQNWEFLLVDCSTLCLYYSLFDSCQSRTKQESQYCQWQSSILQMVGHDGCHCKSLLGC